MTCVQEGQGRAPVPLGSAAQLTRGRCRGTDKYRICPANQRLTESCFAMPEHQLEFADEVSIVKFATGDRRIKKTIVKEGEKLGLDYDEIDYRVDNLIEGSATFFPCTNFIAGPFCEEAGITA